MGNRIAIHHRAGSFSDRWIKYCAEKGIEHRVVNCFDVSIMRQLASADALLWHFSQSTPEDMAVARHILRAAEVMGLMVFPSSNTCWHFDSKVAQKYLLESVGAPLVPTHIFFRPRDAEEWISRATFPKVFKLSCGAGSMNVRMVRDAAEARRLAKRAFGRGFKPVAGYFHDAATRLQKTRRAAVSLRSVVERMPGTLMRIYRANLLLGHERGYVYFQDFVAGNEYDTRVTVIGNRAFAFTRNVRKGDFRASGSGDVVYDRDRIRPECIQVAFEVARKTGSQSMAFDFVRGNDGRYLITEVSYGYIAEAVHACAGHWDRSLNWHEGQVWPQDAILEDLLAELSEK
ncbi:MAG TPA: hypothetical protein VLM89_03455 [Phycisphaerae bacterium]|nr:hypothetical protein [Phycisphaerae bacterium]